MTHHTQGVWQVKPGHGEEFVTAWNEFARWSNASVQGASWATLVRDVVDPNRFVKIGTWDSAEAIDRTRNLDGWDEHVAKIYELLAGVQPSTLETVLELDG